MPKLTVKKIEALKAPGMYGDGQGLYLRIGPTGAKSWILRTMLNGKRRDFGLGSAAALSLADAREQSAAMRKEAKQGRDPAALRDKRQVTFTQAAQELHAALAPTFRNAKHRDQWFASIKNHALSSIGEMDVATVERRDVLELLSPIWVDMHPTAKRLKQRIEAIFDYAIGKGYREASNPVDGALARSLPKGKHKPQHHAALHWRDIPEFVEALKQREAIAAICLRFIILTAARSGEARMATWNEFDLESGTWTIPASRMKMEEEHRVPLSNEALAILDVVRGLDASIPFPSPQSVSRGVGKPLSVNAFRPLYQRMDRTGITTHGLRSTFRDWCAESAHADREVAEAALAHKVGGVEGAYFRSDLFERRRALMQRWGDFVTGGAGGVVRMAE